ncbi:MAG TPA: hypothetical protein VE177_04205, partial [Candidatus Binatus sp.]|nr:hypothetical protein [Candidatus Binatus sp.]
MLFDTTPLGDDALLHVRKIIDLSQNFLHYQWDPRSFNGYNPSIGFAWASYAPPALLVKMGLDPLFVFHVTFISYFVILMPSIYYFARTVGARRHIAIIVSVLGWSTAGYWGYIGGGAYSRVFTLPFAFLALGLTYHFATTQNKGVNLGKIYWLLLASWFVVMLGDIYISAVPIAVAMPFLVLSAGWRRWQLGLRRLGVVMIPAFVLTSWFWIPTVVHAVSVGSPPSESPIFAASQVFWIGPIVTVIGFLFRRRLQLSVFQPERVVMLFSLNLVSIYFLVMGAFTPLWPYIPRFWATYDSFNILSFLFPMIVASLFTWFRSPRRTTILRILAIALIIVVTVNGVQTILLLKPPNRIPQEQNFAYAFSGNLADASEFRVSLQGRTSTRWYPFYYPNYSQTGGRVRGLDPNPYYQSWFDTEVYFKDDLDKLSTVYLEDQPQFDLSSLI